MTQLKERFTTDAVIVAAGTGSRMMAGINKVFLPIFHQEMLCYTIEAFEASPLISNIILVTGERDTARCHELAEQRHYQKLKHILSGGASRRQSVFAGLKACCADFVCIHDGARALITPEEIEKVLKDAFQFQAAALGVCVKDTLKDVDENGFIQGTIDRERTYQIQTPQVFRRDKILYFHEKADKYNIQVTDDCALAEHFGMRVKVTKGSYENIKLTTPEDIFIAEKILKRRMEGSNTP